MAILGTASGFCILGFMKSDDRQLLIDTLLSSEDGNNDEYDLFSIQRELKTKIENLRGAFSRLLLKLSSNIMLSGFQVDVCSAK